MCKNTQRVLVLSLLVSFFLFLNVTAVKAENLLKNPGFEKGNFEGWDEGALGNKEDKGGFSIVDVAHSGKYGAGIYSETKVGWFYLRQKVDIPAGKVVTLTAWVKTNKSNATMILIENSFWGEDPTGHQRVVKQHSGSGKWEQLKVSLKKEEEGMTCVAIGFDYGADDSQMIIDDLSLEVTEETSKAP